MSILCATDFSPPTDIAPREKEIVLRDLSEWIQSVVGRPPESRRALVATDFSDPASRSICFGCNVLEPEGKLRIISVVRHEQDIKKIKGELQKHIPDFEAHLGIEVELTVIVSPEIACAICEEAEHFGANLVCVGTQGADSIPRKLQGSVARAVAARCCRPVRLVPRLAP